MKLEELLKILLNIFNGKEVYLVGSNAKNFTNGFLDENKDIDLIIIGLTNDEIELYLKNFNPIRNRFNGIRICNGMADIWGESNIINYQEYTKSQGYSDFKIRL